MIDCNSLQLPKPIGSTIIPVLGSSDQTHLTNYSGDKEAWPVFLSLGNVRSSEWLKATRNCSVLVAILPIRNSTETLLPQLWKVGGVESTAGL